MRAKVILIIMFILVGFLLGGCGEPREVDELGIVTLTAVDWLEQEEKYKIMVQIISPERSPGGLGGGEPDIWNYSATGDTLMQASKNIRTASSQDLAFFHSRLIVIGKTAAQKGLREVVDFFARNREIRYNSWVLVGDKEASNLLEVVPRKEGFLAQEIEGIIENNENDWSKASPIILKDLLIKLALPHYDETIARLTAHYPKLPPEATYQQQDLMEGLPAEEKRVIAISGMGVFKSGKLQGWADRVETRGFLWVTDDVEGGALIDTVGVGEKSMFSAELLDSSSSLEAVIEEGSLYYRLDINAAVQLTEAVTNLDMGDLDNIQKVESYIAKEIEKEVKAVLRLAQIEYGADIFGYGDLVYRNHPREWEELKEDWEEIFPTVTTAINIDVTIERLGMISQPVME
ncbi:Ger(x)C family spore germination protein [Halonatronum saccharophilum]|uniref:Ger(x)C family spore germination protein n=1 Tax=Halonatronum saccharophilum TaxID=150060 RepID=UPI00047F51BA|nr:Ger(x)C family spore germination protein [Halonatronum saccharophilum]